MPDDALTPDEIATAEELHKAQKELAWQLTRMGVDTATIFDPTGLTNIPAMGMALYDGDFLSAGLSLIGLIPVLGKASDAIKEARMAERAAELGKVVAALTAKLSKLGKLRKEAKIAEEAAKIGKEAKEAKALAEAKEAENALEAAKQALEKAKQTPGACVPCAEKKVAEAEEVVDRVVEAHRLPRERPGWKQTETDIGGNLRSQGYAPQQSFKDGQVVPYGTKGSTRPDYYKPGTSVECKNYNIETPSGRANLVRNVTTQAQHRIANLPPGTKQVIYLDARGQSVPTAELKFLIEAIVNKSNGTLKAVDINILR